EAARLRCVRSNAQTGASEPRGAVLAAAAAVSLAARSAVPKQRCIVGVLPSLPVVASCLRSSRLHDPFLPARTGSPKSSSSYDNRGVHPPVSLALHQSKAIQQPLQLAPAHGQCAVLLGRGPLEAPLLKAAIIEPKPVVIPMQDLNFVSSPELKWLSRNFGADRKRERGFPTRFPSLSMLPGRCGVASRQVCKRRFPSRRGSFASSGVENQGCLSLRPRHGQLGHRLHAQIPPLHPPLVLLLLQDGADQP